MDWLGGGMGMGTRAGNLCWFGIGDDFHGAFPTIDDEFVSRFDGGRRVAGTGHCSQVVFTAHDGGVAHHPTDIGDGGLDLAEDRSPAWRGDRSDQNFTGLYV